MVVAERWSTNVAYLGLAGTVAARKGQDPRGLSGQQRSEDLRRHGNTFGERPHGVRSHHSLKALEKATTYQDGFVTNSEVIKWFWEVVHALSPEQKRCFLQFCTGCDRAPVGGLGRLPLVVSLGSICVGGSGAEL